MPKVSICIPTYNQTIYLKKCIASILMQDYIDYEIIISDDTKDNSVEIFLNNSFPKTNFIYKKNTPPLGSPSNWNATMNLATGEYIKILHHDDFFTEKNSLGKMIDFIQLQKADFLCCDTDVWHIQENYHSMHRIGNQRFQKIIKEPKILFFNNWVGAPSVTLFKNKNVISFDERLKWLVDVDQYIQIFYSNKIVSYLPEALICTIHGGYGQITGNVERNKIIQIREHVLLFNKLKIDERSIKAFQGFFDNLFFKFEVNDYQSLMRLAPECNSNEIFFKNIIEHLDQGRKWKYFKKRFFESRYNNYIFKFEQYI